MKLKTGRQNNFSRSNSKWIANGALSPDFLLCSLVYHLINHSKPFHKAELVSLELLLLYLFPKKTYYYFGSRYECWHCAESFFRPLDQDEKSDEAFFKKLRNLLLLGNGRWRNGGHRGHLLTLMSYGRATEQDIRNPEDFWWMSGSRHRYCIV